LKLSLKRNSNLLTVSFKNAIHDLLQGLSFNLYFRPDRVDVRFTLRCNLRCRHCFNWSCISEELNTDIWKEMIIKLKKWLGPFFLIIGGGEPLIRNDLIELINFSYKLKIATALNTNGTLIDKYMADKLVESSLNMISISIDGFELTHNFLRGEGTYKKAINAINYLKGRIILQIDTVIMDCNLDEILKLVEYAENNKIGILFQGLLCGKSAPVFSNAQIDSLWPKDIKKTSRIFDKLILKKKKSQNIMNSIRSLQLLKSYYIQSNYNVKYNCQAYKNNFTIFPNGNIRVCPQFGSLGDLTLSSPKAIWNSKEVFWKRKQMKNCYYPCAFLSCRFRENIFEKILRSKNIFLMNR